MTLPLPGMLMLPAQVKEILESRDCRLGWNGVPIPHLRSQLARSVARQPYPRVARSFSPSGTRWPTSRMAELRWSPWALVLVENGTSECQEILNYLVLVLELQPNGPYLNLVEISAAEKKKHCEPARRAATLSFFSQYHHSHMNVEASHTL